MDEAIQCVLGTRSRIAIIMMADYMGLGAEARINEPSTLGGNWVWRAYGYDTPKLKKKVREFTKRCGRLRIELILT